MADRCRANLRGTGFSIIPRAESRSCSSRVFLSHSSCVICRTSHAGTSGEATADRLDNPLGKAI